ncbi:MAG: ATP synthase subunit I [Anaerolineae bacterium]|nr:ATP synthase subunit I [Anaerolineae bacterium]
MLNKWLSLVPAVIAGVALGAFYFGGLWLTVQQLTKTRRPVLLALGSLVIRLGMTLLGIFLVTGGEWVKIGICLLGFFAMRTILVHRWQPQMSPAVERGSSHGTQS